MQITLKYLTYTLWDLLDGINDSLLEPVVLEETESDTKVDFKIDFEKLYFNMLDAKADYLYELPQMGKYFFEREKKGNSERL